MGFLTENNIFIISEDKEKASEFSSKIVLFREYDAVKVVDMEKAEICLKSQNPDLVLFHLQRDYDVHFIKKLRSFSSLANTSIILLTENDESEVLCDAFDYGADDFMMIDSKDTELIMRVMWGLQRKTMLDISAKKSEILSQIDVTDFATGFYKKDYTRKFFAQEYGKLASSGLRAEFMIISTDLNSKGKITQNRFAEIIKKSIRINDLCGFTQEEKFYILLNKTSEEGAKCLFERINKYLPKDVSVSAAAAGVCSDINFEDAEHNLIRQLGEALIKGKSLNFVIKKEANIVPSMKFAGKLEVVEIPERVKSILMAKLEKLIVPAFFKMQAIYEPKFFNTRFFHKFSEKQSIFTVKSEHLSVEIIITYEDYKHINVELLEMYNGERNVNKSAYDITEFSSEVLENIMQDALEKFRVSLYEEEEELL